MNKRFTLLFLFLLSGRFLLSAQEPVVRDTFDITSRTMLFPHPPEKWAFKISAGLSMVKPPKDLLENAIQAPLVNIHMIFGLPWNLSLESNVTTLIVSNQLTLGPRFSYLYKNFGVNAGWDIAFIYGQLRQGGFDNSLQAWMHYPNLSVGYKLKKMAFTLKGEVVIVTKSVSKTGENEVDRSKNFFNGGTLGFYLEQRIHKNKVFVIGIKDNYEKIYWPTWMLFSTFNRYYHIPELYLSWIL
jgi:hypothetical protein